MSKDGALKCVYEMLIYQVLSNKSEKKEEEEDGV